MAPWATTQYWHWLAVAGRDDDHLALGLRQVAVILHQRVVVGEERTELFGPVCKHEKHVGNEAGLLLDSEEPATDIRRQILKRRRRVTTYRAVSHTDHCSLQECLPFLAHPRSIADARTNRRRVAADEA
jgi:hypothetical protein